MTLDQIEALNTEATVFKSLFAKMEEEFVSSDAQYYYLLSKKWFDKWKRYISYDQISAGLQPDDRFHGQIPPGSMNRDILEDFQNAVKFPDDSHISNVYLKDQIQAQTDYLILSEALWKEYKLRYPGIEIKRPVIVLPDGHKRIEARLKPFNVVFINNQFLRNMDHGRLKEFFTHKLQYFSQAQVKDFKRDILEVLNSKASEKYLTDYHRQNYTGRSRIEEDNLRVWHLDPRETLQQTFEGYKKHCNEANSYDYKIPFTGDFLEKFPEKTLEETNVAETDYVFFEINESRKAWNFIHLDVPILEKCEGCYGHSLLKYPCLCGKIFYCSMECKEKDRKFHMNRCAKAQEEEEKALVDIKETSASCLGVTGLQNLGNTCFMNSGLQCLSNFKELTEYFLSGRFQHEINETNPLGTKGKLVREYANLVKNLWYGKSSVVSPWSFKRGLGQFQTMFSGYQQHDSQELINFLLDGLHEDLNRVKDKPIVEILESDNTQDESVPKMSWYNYLKRNQSVIVDLLHGQFKSQLTCPDCQRVSITYDPFMTISVPIPYKKQKDIEFFYVHNDLRQKAYRLIVPYPDKQHTVKELKYETAKLINRDPNSFYFVFLTQTTRELILDEEKTTTSELRKKRKVRTLFAVEKSAEDLKLSNKKIEVELSITKKASDYSGRYYRKPCTFKRVISFESSYSTKQVYLKIFKMFRFLYDEYLPEGDKQRWLKLSNEEAFKQIYENKESGKRHFRIYLVTNTHGYDKCYFCGDSRCQNCELECSAKKKLDEDFLSKIKDKQNYSLEFEVFFDNVPEQLDFGRLNSCIELSKNVDANSPGKTGDKGVIEGPKEGVVPIYECFRQFGQPEQLGEDNMWYCNKCKKHQRAYKKMDIYKAPPILIVHLKRFKSGASYSSGKIQALIDFPVTELDLTEFVTNHELPMDYPIKLPPRTKETQQLTKEQEQGKDEKKGKETPKEINNLKVVKEGSEPKLLKKIENPEPPRMLGDQAVDDEEEEKESRRNRLMYDLFGIVNHYGSTGFGHYTAFAKNWRSDKWYCFDDSAVKETHEQSVCTSAAYVLFYRRKDWKFKSLESKANLVSNGLH